MIPERVMKPGGIKEVPCANPQCGKRAHLEIPQIEVINQRSYSSYHFSHENLAECEHCGQTYMFILGKLGPQGMQFTFLPVEVKQENRILAVPGNEWTDRKLKSN